MKISKRILSALTSVACMLTVSAGVSVSVSAADDNIVETGGLTCKTYADHVEVIGCDAAATSVTIAQEVYNLPVTAIASKAFADCTALTQVIIPNGVTSIGNDAFSGCSALNSISIPESVKSVGANAFYDTDIVNKQKVNSEVCYVSNWAVAPGKKGTAAEIKSGTIGIANGTFYNYGLETVNLPSSIITIGSEAFANNGSIRTLTIPAGTKTIGSYAFYGCSGINTLSIGATVADIGSNAFNGCTNLGSKSAIKIPGSVTHIGQDAFAGTYEYKNQDGPEIYIDSWLVDCLDSEKNIAVNIKSGTVGISDFAVYNKKHVTSATIPSGVISVGSFAFSGCSSLSQLSIPDTLTTIGDNAFQNTLITSITFPSSVSYIGNAAFSGCSNLTDITVLNSKCTIYDSPFTFPSGSKVTLYVNEGSTAYDYALKYGITFKYSDPNETDAVLGDVSNNGVVDLNDAIIIAKHVIGKPLTEQQRKVADFNKDGKINLLDVIAICRAIIKK